MGSFGRLVRIVAAGVVAVVVGKICARVEREAGRAADLVAAEAAAVVLPDSDAQRSVGFVAARYSDQSRSLSSSLERFRTLVVAPMVASSMADVVAVDVDAGLHTVYCPLSIRFQTLI